MKRRYDPEFKLEAVRLVVEEGRKARDVERSLDITYTPTAEGWLYLAVVVDVFSRRIVGRSMNERMKDDLVVEALKNALYRRKPTPGFIFHSDQGGAVLQQTLPRLPCHSGSRTEHEFHRLLL